MRKKFIKKFILASLFAGLLFGITAAHASAMTVAAIMYHEVVWSEEELTEYSVLPEQVESDIQLLLENGYTFITPSDLLEIDADTDTNKYVLLTVDDGYQSFYTCFYQLCQKYNIKATLNMIGAKVGVGNAVTAEQLKEMSDSGLIEIGNHTYLIHRRSTNELWGMYHDPSYYEDILYDVALSDKILEGIIGKEVVSIAYPNGITSQEVDTMIKEQLGYKISFTTNFDTITYNGDFSAPFNRMNRDYRQSSETVLEIIQSRTIEG